MNTIFDTLMVHNNPTWLYLITYIPRFAEISLKTVGMIPLGLVIAISFVCIAFYQYLQDLEIVIRHYSIMDRKYRTATINVAWVELLLIFAWYKCQIMQFPTWHFTWIFFVFKKLTTADLIIAEIGLPFFGCGKDRMPFCLYNFLDCRAWYSVTLQYDIIFIQKSSTNTQN